jgi:ABC-2 type transport system permease protein
LCGRAGETRHEPPLSRVQREPYGWYQKGALVMYALSDYIGKEKLNSAPKKFLEQSKYAKDPYPDTIGFAAAIREDAPPSFNTWSRICLSPSCCTRTKP